MSLTVRTLFGGIGRGAFHRLVLLGVCALVFALLLTPTGAAAAPSPLWQAPEAGSDANSAAAGSLKSPSGIATDPKTGHIYVAEGGRASLGIANARIDEFTSWGVFVKAWGWGVRDGSPELQSCTKATGCLAGLEGGGVEGAGAGQLSEPKGIAVDPASGDIYVNEGVANEGRVEGVFRVQKFNAAGEFLLMFGGDVVSGGAAGSGDLSSGSPIVTNLTTTAKAFRAGQTLTAAGLAAGTRITAVGVGTLTLSRPAVATTPAAALTVAEGAGNVPTNERQTVTVGGAPSGGSFTLTVTSATTTGRVSAGSDQVTATHETTGTFRLGEPVTSPCGCIPAGATVAAIDTTTGTLTLSANATKNLAPGLTATETTAAIAHDAPASGPGSVAEALEKLPAIGAGNVAVGGPAGGPYAVEFTGPLLADTDLPQLRANAAGLTPAGTVTVATAVQGAGVGEVCTVAASCQGGSAGSANGQFNAKSNEFAIRIAVGPGGTVYVGDEGRIQAFNANGVFKGQITTGLAGKTVQSLAVDSAGNLYYSLVPIGFLKPNPDVHKLSPTGEALEPTFAVPDPHSVAVDSHGNVYVVERNEEGFGVPKYEPRVLEFDPQGSCIVCIEDSFASPPLGQGFALPSLATNLLGDGTGAPGDLYVLSSSENKSYLTAYGPIPRFEPAPERAPTIEDQFAVSAGTESAVVRALINPHFFQATSYYVEYGTGKCSAGGCATQPTPPGASLGGERNIGIPTAALQLGGLQPGTTYHFRFVAISGAFTTKGVGEAELEGTVTTARAGAAQLPDGRAYEMVSPPEKEGGDVAVPGSPGGLVNLTVRPQQAAPSGEAITYASFTAFGEDPKSAPGASQYLSRRGPGGWSTENITPPYSAGFTRDPLRGFSPDLSRAAVIQREPVLVPGAPEGVENLYLRDRSGALSLVSDAQPEFAADYCISFGGASADFSRVIFAASGALTAEAPVVAGGQNLYEWSPAEGIRLVSVLPDESPAAPTGASGFGTGGEAQCLVSSKIMHNAISADGSRIFWTSGSEQLLARLNGTETIALDATQGGPGPAGRGEYWAASDDGSKVFFTDPNKLTATANAEDLYRYDFDAAAGSELADISPGPEAARVQGVLGASEDGSYVYFVALGALSGEEANAAGAKAKAGQSNLYRWHQGEGLRFIATLRGGLNESDQSDWEPWPAHQTARVSPDGQHLAFLSVQPLTGFDNRDQVSGNRDREAFLYDAGTGALVCASCNPSGARPIGAAALPVWSTPYEQPRYLSDDGSRLFFATVDALDLRDTNRRADVYQFERAGTGDCSAQNPTFSAESGGCVGLISSGSSGSDSHLVDASADGRDVFISTAQQLLPQDRDERYDVYDARVGGGFPQPPPAGEPCEGEACRPPQSPPAEATPGSSGFAGPGNVKPAPARHCPKGKRKVRKKGEVRCVSFKQGKDAKPHKNRKAQR